MKKAIVLLILVALLGVGIYFLLSNDTEENGTENQTDQTEETGTEESTEDEMSEEMEDEQSDAGYMDISAQEAYQLSQENEDVVIVDVSSNYDEGHIPGAVNYYVGDGSLDEAIPTLDKEATYLVYCHVDSAAIAGAEKLVEAGFENVYRLEGNYQAWVDAGYNVEK